MGCIEIKMELIHMILYVSINRNMGCIEMLFQPEQTPENHR